MLALLDAFSVESPVWSADDLAARFDLAPSTCYRYLKSLHQAGLLARVGSGSVAANPPDVTMALTITPVNDAPTVTLGGGATTGTPVALASPATAGAGSDIVPPTRPTAAADAPVEPSDPADPEAGVAEGSSICRTSAAA